VAVSDQVAEYARQHGSTAANIQIVPNGVRLERFAFPSAATKRAATTFSIGFVGSLRPWHAVDDLISAFAQMKSAEPFCPLRLRIVGQGPQRESLEAQVASLSAAARTAIDFSGAIGYDDIPREIAEFDVAAAPYANEQACYFSPLKLFEYMAAELPVVAARTGQLAEIIRHRENGLLYAPGDIDALVAALWELYDAPALRVRLGQAARRDVARHHTWHRRVDQILEAALAGQRVSSTTTTAS
jgi:glycosyltransferase involved in cell wall biosynthesis